MRRKIIAISAELRKSGLSQSTLNLLWRQHGVNTLDDLKSKNWGSIKEKRGLSWDLFRTPMIGPRVYSEVEALLEGRSLDHLESTFHIGAKIPPYLRDKIDAYAKRNDISRSLAIRLLLEAGIHSVNSGE
jgi:hypothetical protein